MDILILMLNNIIVVNAITDISSKIIKKYTYNRIIQNVNGAADLSNSDIMYQVTTQDYCQYKLSK